MELTEIANRRHGQRPPLPPPPRGAHAAGAGRDRRGSSGIGQRGRGVSQQIKNSVHAVTKTCRAITALAKGGRVYWWDIPHLKSQSPISATASIVVDGAA